MPIPDPRIVNVESPFNTLFHTEEIVQIIARRTARVLAINEYAPGIALAASEMLEIFIYKYVDEVVKPMYEVLDPAEKPLESEYQLYIGGYCFAAKLVQAAILYCGSPVMLDEIIEKIFPHENKDKIKPLIRAAGYAMKIEHSGEYVTPLLFEGIEEHPETLFTPSTEQYFIAGATMFSIDLQYLYEETLKQYPHLH